MEKHRILLGEHEILKNHGVFYPRALSDELVFELTLSLANVVVKGSDANDLDFELTNIQLEYETLHDVGLTKEARSTYLNGKAFMYNHVTHHKWITIKHDSDPIINESINIPRRSIKGSLLLFCEPHTAGARDSEKLINPDITSVKVNVNGMPNKVYSQGLKSVTCGMRLTDFYADDKFGLFIDLRIMEDTRLHGSGLRLVNTKDGVQLEIKRTPSGSGDMKCHIFIISDAQFSVINNELESIQY